MRIPLYSISYLVLAQFIYGKTIRHHGVYILSHTLLLNSHKHEWKQRAGGENEGGGTFFGSSLSRFLYKTILIRKFCYMYKCVICETKEAKAICVYCCHS